jgi:hypothetical protein
MLSGWLFCLRCSCFSSLKEKRKKAKRKKTGTLTGKQCSNLAELEKERDPDPKAYYTTLINIFRTYLKGAKGIQSFSKTTDDLSIQLQAQKIPSPAYNSLVQTLRLSDMAKFAAYRPDGSMDQESLTIIKQSITTLEQANVV